MKVLVTGADGFVGQWLIRELLSAGHHVTGAFRLGGAPPAGLSEAERNRVQWLPLELQSQESVDAVAAARTDGVVHLAAVASGAEARQDPGYAWTVNAAGTARLCEAVADQLKGSAGPLFVLVSTGEVYGQGGGTASVEMDGLDPCSPYAASKVGAELAAREVSGRTGLRVAVARPFPHTGPGQSERYALPAIAARLRIAKRIGAPAIKTGPLTAVRDYLDVRDVVVAYRLLLERGQEGAIYNIASGRGRQLQDVVTQLAAVIGVRVITETDPNLSRPNDLRRLVGDASRLRRELGWTPAIEFAQTLRDLIDAQTD
jgi:GDP-4-dehydro-6-deoxy-D-mannose reductase